MGNDTPPPSDKSDLRIPPFLQQQIEIAKRISLDEGSEKDKRDEALVHNMIEIHRKELEDVGTQLAKAARKRREADRFGSFTLLGNPVKRSFFPQARMP